MDTNPVCQPFDLANNECCGIALCPLQDALKTILVEPAPATPDQSPTPTGQVFSGSDEFPCSGTSFTGIPIAAPSRFLVVTEDGNLQCWAETGSSQAQGMRSFTLAVNGEDGSVYKGLAITPFSSGNRLYAANFGLRRIDSFDGAFQPILSGTFVRPAEVPEDFAPFNIQFLEYEIDRSSKASSSPMPRPLLIRSRRSRGRGSGTSRSSTSTAGCCVRWVTAGGSTRLGVWP